MKPKIKPPRGYRIMRPMERPNGERGDMVFSFADGWTTTLYSGGITVGRILKTYPFVEAYARKIK